MNIDDITKAVAAQDSWVKQERNRWRDGRDAYEDNFWREEISSTTVSDKSRAQGKDGILMQVNRLRPWVISYVSSLFYRALHAVVALDPIVREGDPEEAPALEPVQSMIDWYLNSEEFKALAKQAFECGLMYPYCAFQVCAYEPAAHPLDRIHIRLLQAWEVLWDRKARDMRDLRFVGSMTMVSKESLLRQYGARMPEKLAPRVRADVVAEGLEIAVTETNQDENYVRVLELFDFTEDHEETTTEVLKHTAPNPDDPEGEPIEMTSERVTKVTTRGTYCVYILDAGGHPTALTDPKAIPFAWQDGQPCVPIIPVVLAHRPEFPLWGIRPAGSVYALVHELNFATTALAQAFRKEAARVLLLLKDKFDTEALAALKSGEDHVIVEIIGSQLDGLAQWLEAPPVNQAMMTYVQELQNGMNDIQGTAPVTRGTPTKYVTAYESERLNDYTETTLGTYRDQMDVSIGQLAEVFLRVLSATMEDAELDEIRIRVLDKVVTVPQALLDCRWRVSMTESANTPAKQAKRQQALATCSEPLAKFVTLASDPNTPPELQVFAQRLIDLLVEYYDLPDELKWEKLSQSTDLAKAPPPAPPPTTTLADQPGAGGGAPVPQETPNNLPASVAPHLDAIAGAAEASSLGSPGNPPL